MTRSAATCPRGTTHRLSLLSLSSRRPQVFLEPEQTHLLMFFLSLSLSLLPLGYLSSVRLLSVTPWISRPQGRCPTNSGLHAPFEADEMETPPTRLVVVAAKGWSPTLWAWMRRTTSWQRGVDVIATPTRLRWPHSTTTGTISDVLRGKSTMHNTKLHQRRPQRQPCLKASKHNMAQVVKYSLCKSQHNMIHVANLRAQYDPCCKLHQLDQTAISQWIQRLMTQSADTYCHPVCGDFFGYQL